MKKLLETKSLNETREEALSTAKFLLNKYNLKSEDITPVGITESGNIQYKVANSIKNRQVIILIGYLKWSFNLTEEELK